ncbi:MAG: serine hydrolase [Saprospiraceae bacterium]|nr:serine hydrolase [Saprospiraceae bacterium]
MNYLSIVVCIVLSHSIVNGQDLYFPPNFSSEWASIAPSELNWCEENIENLNSFLETTNSNAFIVLKDGKIAHEAYFNDFDMNSSWYWASAGKSLTAAMVGILQEEGSLNINDPTTQYLGQGWTNCTVAEENQITLWHQLTMTSGLDYTTGDIYCTEPECLTYLNAPGEEWYYHNAPYTLLSDVMESALDQSYTGITNQKLANKIGFIGLWTNVETGRLFFSTIRGMARFGLLMLNNGDWDGQEIIKDKAYFDDMINTSQDINPSYGYLWWLNGKESHRLPASLFDFQGSIIPDAPEDLYAAIGKNGQILIVVPSQNLIIARMGNNPDESLVPVSYIRSLWSEYEKLSCPLSTQKADQIKFTVFPSLVESRVEIRTDQTIDKVNVYSSDGRWMLSSYSKNIDLSSLFKGVYLVEVRSGNSQSVKRIVKM